MISPSPDVVIPLEIRSALMTLKLRKPTIEEIENMEFHTLTSDDQWIPRDHNDLGFQMDTFTAQTQEHDTPMPPLVPMPIDADNDDDSEASLPPLQPRDTGLYDSDDDSTIASLNDTDEDTLVPAEPVPDQGEIPVQLDVAYQRDIYISEMGASVGT